MRQYQEYFVKEKGISSRDNKISLMENESIALGTTQETGRRVLHIFKRNHQCSLNMGSGTIEKVQGIILSKGFYAHVIYC